MRERRGGPPRAEQIPCRQKPALSFGGTVSRSAMAARLCWAGGSASSAASLRAIPVWRLMMASKGDSIGSLVSGA